MNTNTMVVYAVGGWLSASVVVLTCVAPRLPVAGSPTSIEAVDRLLEHTRAAAAALAGILRAASADPADLLAEARYECGRGRHLLPPVLAEFGPESDVGRSAMSLLGSLQAAVDSVDLALLRGGGRAWTPADGALLSIRLAQDRLMRDVWGTLERRAGGARTPAPL